MLHFTRRQMDMYAWGAISTMRERAMKTYRAALVGCSRMGAFIDNEQRGASRFKQPYSHAAGYEACERTELMACSDLRPDVLEQAGRAVRRVDGASLHRLPGDDRQRASPTSSAWRRSRSSGRRSSPTRQSTG